MRIAVIRLSSFGDVLCTGPSVRSLKSAFPGAHLVFVTTANYAEIASALPGVDEVIVIERRGEGFERDVAALAAKGPWERVADLQGSPRSRRIVNELDPTYRLTDKPPRIRRSLLIYGRVKLGTFTPVPKRMLRTLEPWSVHDDGGSLMLSPPSEVQDRVKKRWGKAIRGAIVFVTGAKHETKRWPDVYWTDLVSLLDKGAPIVVIGEKGELPEQLAKTLDSRGDAHDLTGKTSPLELAAVLGQASVVVTGDTGPMHLAVAMGAPVVALFGPTVREFGFFPFRAVNSAVLERKLWCRPCSAHGMEKCPLRNHRCMRDILPEEVAEAVNRIRGNSNDRQ